MNRALAYSFADFDRDLLPIFRLPILCSCSVCRQYPEDAGNWLAYVARGALFAFYSDCGLIADLRPMSRELMRRTGLIRRVRLMEAQGGFGLGRRECEASAFRNMKKLAGGDDVPGVLLSDGSEVWLLDVAEERCRSRKRVSQSLNRVKRKREQAREHITRFVRSAENGGIVDASCYPVRSE